MSWVAGGLVSSTSSNGTVGRSMARSSPKRSRSTVTATTWVVGTFAQVVQQRAGEQAVAEHHDGLVQRLACVSLVVLAWTARSPAGTVQPSSSMGIACAGSASAPVRICPIVFVMILGIQPQRPVVHVPDIHSDTFLHRHATCVVRRYQPSRSCRAARHGDEPARACSSRGTPRAEGRRRRPACRRP